jgi:hypothetical protein
VLSDGSVLVMGGFNGGTYKNDVWKTVDGGASWILVTSSAPWSCKKIIQRSNSLPILPPQAKISVDVTATVILVPRMQM